ncbi:MAG: hypothetical protein IIB56_13425 [Planctomycetes bacterium]|nr:hypothetical protein [Planctomycetota bacterium]MCH8120196.1 hypothetical protein [Planctomycetota bacterium]
MLGDVVFSTLRTFLADNAGIGLPLGIERVIRIGSKAGEIDIDEEEVGKLDIAEYIQDVEQHPKMSYVDLLVVGMKKEEISRKLYADLATIAKTQEMKDIFLKLAQEEAGHKLRFEIEYDLMTF